METVKSLVLRYRESEPSDDAFILKMRDLIDQQDEGVCQAIFQVFAGIKLRPSEARQYWDDVLRHREDISKRLGRSVNLLSVMYDYFDTHGNFFDTPKLVEMSEYEKATRDSTHDSLTGLYNRRYMTSSLDQLLALAERYDNDVSLLFIDVDDFKEVNDTLGHQAGDEVLCQIARVISQEIRQSDIAVRYGGEEFVVLMPNTSSIDALILADRIRENVESNGLEITGKELKLTVSGGIASFPINARNAEDLINLADSALYRAKGAGKNNISLFKADNRRFLRISLSETIRIKELGFSNSKSFSGLSKDICVGGLLFENSKMLKIGSKIQISVPIGNEEPILLIGTVVRVEVLEADRFDIGVVIAFKEMDKLAKTGISKFLVKQARELNL